jgi:N-succinyldiaminopimelate aminotransferase
MAFCLDLPGTVGVAAIPMSAFCVPQGPYFAEWNHLVRFAFCKRDETLDEAVRRLQSIREVR